jgi:outer membrane protein TolC
LDALSLQIEALRYKATQAGAWSDPTISFAYQNVPWDSFALDQEPMSMVLFRIEQTVPFFGKTGKREAVVIDEAQAKRWQLEERKSQLRALVKQAYLRLALARQIKKITKEHISLIEQLIDAVRIKYEVGRAAQSDLLRLEVLRDRLKDSIEDFDRQDRELTASINATLHRAVTTNILTPETFALTGPAHSIKELKKMALVSRPQLKQLKALAKMHRSAADLAATEAIPDPAFFASYALRSELEAGGAGRDLITLGVGIPLPLFYSSRYGARAQEATASARATDAQRTALLDTISGGLGEALAGWQRAFDQVNRYKDQLVPGAHKALDATFSSYQVDRADFSSLYEAELELLNFEGTIRIAVVQGLLAQTRIEQLIGRKL